MKIVSRLPASCERSTDWSRTVTRPKISCARSDARPRQQQRRTEASIDKLSETVDKVAEAQRKTEEQQRKTEASLGKLNETVDKVAEAQRKTEEQQRKTEASLGKLNETVDKVAEAQRKTEASLGKLNETVNKVAEAQRKTEASLDKLSETVDKVAEAQRKTEEQQRKTEASLDKLSKQMGNFGNMQGRVVEEMFYRNAVAQLRLRFVPVTRVLRNINPFGDREFDVMAHDGPRSHTGFLLAAWIGLIEIKNRPTIDDVDTLIKEQIPDFLQGLARMSQVEGYTVIGAIGGLIIDDPVRDYAEENGIYVLTQRGEDGASIANAGDFIPRDFVTGEDARLPSELPDMPEDSALPER